MNIFKKFQLDELQLKSCYFLLQIKMLIQIFSGLCFAVPNARRMPGVRNIHIVRQIIIERDCLATMVCDLTSGSSEFFFNSVWSYF